MVNQHRLQAAAMSSSCLYLHVKPFDRLFNETLKCMLMLPVHDIFFLHFSSPSVEEENPEFWRSQARTSLQSVLDRKLNTNVAKNIVFFLGDGI